jgi:hypothetical protein
MSEIRFPHMNLRTSGTDKSYIQLLEADLCVHNTTQNNGANEFVFDPACGTFASLQEPSSVGSFLNNGNTAQAYNFVL